MDEVTVATLDDIADGVASRESCLAFVEALANDHAQDAAHEKQRPSSPYGATAGGWQNTSVDAFLEAAVAYARDAGSPGEAPTWRDLAVFLLRGRSYE